MMEPKPKMGSGPALNGKTALIADDDETVASFFEALLNSAGFSSIVVHTGKDALEKLKLGTRRKIDLLVLDMMMPTPGGYEVLKQLQSGGYQSVPIFIVTAREMDKQAAGLLKLESNVHSVWSKPVDQDEFLKQACEAAGSAPKE